MDDLPAELVDRAERAGGDSSAMLKLRSDLAEAWATAPEEETAADTAERLLGVYVRAGYGLGYVDALTD